MKYFVTTFLCLFLLGGALVFAQEVSVQVTNDHPRVGEPVQFTVTVRGARAAQVPQTLSVKGLRIQLVGQSTQLQMLNMQMNFSVTYTYTVVPQSEGEHTIPAFDVKVGKQVLRTQSIQLFVGSGAQPLPQIPPPSSFDDESESEDSSVERPYFAELLISKKKAYVGEVIPTELRFYFSSRHAGKVGERPSFSGEGFTVQKFSNASQREVVVEGENYVVFSFQTAITPAKAGVLEIPAAKLQALLSVPGESSQSFPDIFRNFGGMFTETQEVMLETQPVSLEVVPLPKEGRPDDFSGAIGKFTLEASVSPKKTTAGEPLTLTATISGQGNFEAMGAPVLTNDDGWRSYPPSEKFESSDAIQFSGKKTFEFPIIARQDQTQTPGLKFSYFDPIAEKYVTLTQDPFDVEVKVAASPVVASSPGTPQATPSPSLAEEIIVTDSGDSTWEPLFFRRGFVMVNSVIAGVWLAFFGVFIMRKFSMSAAAQERARRRRAKELLARLRHADDRSFYELAVDYICSRLKTDNDIFSAIARIDSSTLPLDLKSTLKHVLDRHDESKYAAGTSVKPSVDERSQVIKALEEFAKYEK